MSMLNRKSVPNKEQRQIEQGVMSNSGSRMNLYNKPSLTPEIAL
jgi:hypothetical protein